MISSKAILGLSAIVAVLTVPAQAWAGALYESDLMGIYESCLLEQTAHFNSAVFSREPLFSTAAEYHDPLVGPATLNIQQILSDPNRFQKRFVESHFQYRRGRLQLELETCDSEVHDGSEVCSGNSVKTRPFALPYFKYQTRRAAIWTQGQLGERRKEEFDVLEAKPTLMGDYGPDELPFVNDETGAPILDEAGQPVAFQVRKYKNCLTAWVERAATAVTAIEVGGQSSAVEGAHDAKVVSADREAARVDVGARQSALGAR